MEVKLEQGRHLYGKSVPLSLDAYNPEVELKSLDTDDSLPEDQ